jgi:hypothetical protein
MLKDLRNMGIRTPWSLWDGDERAYLTDVPPVGIYDEAWDEWEKHNYVDPESPMARGLVPQLAAFVNSRIKLSDAVDQLPLAWFRDIVRKPTDQEYDIAKEITLDFAARIKSVNFSDVKSWQAFQKQQREALEKVSMYQTNRQRLAECLWYVVHDEERSNYIQRQAGRMRSRIGSVVFILFPEEAAELSDRYYRFRILKEDIGLEAEPIKSRANGLVKTMPGQKDPFEAVVEVVQFDDPRKPGVKRLGCILKQQLPGFKGPDQGYPAGMICVIDLRGFAPAGQMYRAHFIPFSERSWDVTLTEVPHG